MKDPVPDITPEIASSPESPVVKLPQKLALQPEPLKD